MEEDDIDLNTTINSIKKFGKEKPHIMIVVLLIILFLLGMAAGYRAGYINGYRYVDDWYENYIEKVCFCEKYYAKNDNLTINLDSISTIKTI